MIDGMPEAGRYLQGWLDSLTVLHRGHWDASRWYGQLNLWLGVGTAVCAAISGTSAFAAAAGGRATAIAGWLGVSAAVLAAVQTSLRASELSAKHKQAGIRFGQLRRELQEQLALGLPSRGDPEAAELLSSLRDRWASADDESPPVPPYYYERAKRGLLDGEPRDSARA